MKTFLMCENDLEMTSHSSLEEYMKDRSMSKSVRNELRLLFRKCYLTGSCKFSTGLARYIHGRRDAGMISYVLNKSGLFQAVPNENGSLYKVGVSSKTYAFVKPGIIKPEVVSEEDSELDKFFFGMSSQKPKVSEFFSVPVTIPSSFLQRKYDRWETFNQENGYVSKLDNTGRTPWGKAILDGITKFNIPEFTKPEVERLIWEGKKTPPTEKAINWWCSLVTNIHTKGVPYCVYRKRHRAYHSLVWCPSIIRRQGWFDYHGKEKAVTIDLKCSYGVFLAEHCNSHQEKQRYIDFVKNGQFYEEIAEASDYQWRDRQALKKEFMRQVVFYKKGHPEESRPLFGGFHRMFPNLASSIRRLRKKQSVTQFSNNLMEKESALFIDGLSERLGQYGIPCVSVHDAVIVPESVVDLVIGELEELSELHLGFVPNFEFKNEVDKHECQDKVVS
jgi:hypothetical protein